MHSKIKTDKIPNPYSRKIPVTFKVNSEEMQEIIAKAQQYFDGNISLMLRTCLKQFKPKK